MGFIDLATNLIFPPRCANCGELISVELNKKQIDPLCPTCRMNFENEKLLECGTCGLAMCFCRCMPKNMSRAQCSSLLKLVSYRPEGDDMPIRDFIYSVKHSNNKVTFDFFAEQMRGVLIPEMRSASIVPTDCVITFLPRSHKNKVSDGFDQGYELAKSLSKITGIELVKCFDRVLFTTEQKKLNQYERRLNMKSAYELRGVDKIIKDKTVILVDDIVTTGASMASGARLLFSCGAFSVIGVSIGTTEKNFKK
jgi:ComF family protein